MTRAAYRVMTPLHISFSGGRSSAYMLRMILDAYGGMPMHTHILFANTGKERDETLDFVHEVETRWQIPITWLEYGGNQTVRVVNYETAHRTSQPGSPFEVLLSEMACLPNPIARNCTKQLKIRAMNRWLEQQGWGPDFQRRVALGIRLDEMDRTIQISADCPSYITPVFPMVSRQVVEQDVMKFWKKQPFDLQLESHEGNCDLCFLKSRGKLIRLIREGKADPSWWLRMESEPNSQGNITKFRDDRTYSGIVTEASQPVLFDVEDDGVPCSCGTGVGDWN